MKAHPIFYSFLFIFLLLAFLFAVFFGVSSLRSGIPPAFFGGGRVAVLEIEGPIFDSYDVVKEIDEFSKDDSIKAVLVRIDSPGGAVSPSQEIFEELKKLRDEKKIVVSMGTIAASGGYYIATAAHKIFANPGTVTGSIGVIMKGLNLAELVKLTRVEREVVKSGKFKDAGSPFRKMTPEERAYFQSVIDNMYGQFKRAVSGQRGIPLEKLSEIADGRIYTGEQALALGLVDEIGTIYDAAAEAKKMAGLHPDAPLVWPRDYPTPLGWFVRRKLQSQDLIDIFQQYFRDIEMPFGFYMMEETYD